MEAYRPGQRHRAHRGFLRTWRPVWRLERTCAQRKSDRRQFLGVNPAVSRLHHEMGLARLEGR